MVLLLSFQHKKGVTANEKFFYDKMLVRSKFFRQFVEKFEKFKFSLSKQHNKTLKMRSEILKIRKKAKQSSSGKFSGNFPKLGNPKDCRDPENFPGS